MASTGGTVDELPQVDEQPAPRKKRKGGLLKKLVMGVVVLLVVAGAGGWWMLRGTSAEAEEPPLESRGVISFEPFLVNLADSGGNRFLKVTVQLVLGTSEEAKHVAETPVVMMHLRSSILELLTMQQAAVLVTADGKKALKEAIKTRVAPDLRHQKVIDVLFSEFVVQF